MKSRLSIILTTIALLFASVAVQAQVPRTINYQGYLTTPAGGAVSNPGLQVVFRIYDVASSGTALHTETQTVVVTNGIFNVLLGSAATLALPFDVQYYLGVTPGADAEMTPRQPLAASPYAIRALTATSALTANTANTATTATTAASADALSPSAAVPGSQISNGSITAAKLASSGCTGNQVLQYNGSAWLCVTLPAGGSGTVTSVAAGTGLTGGTITASGTIAADTTYLQRRVAASCAAGSSIRAIEADGTVTCQTDTTGGSGTVTSITTGEGLIGGTITGSGTISIDPNDTQRRVAGSCPAGSSIRAIANDGSVTCQINGTDTVATPQPNAPSTPLPGPFQGKMSSVTIGADGMPVMAYVSGSSAQLMTLKCSTINCQGSVTMNSIGSASGNPPSITIGTDGFPVISYQDGGALKLAKCSHAACATVVIRTLEPSGVPTTAGYPSAITIGADGFAQVLYWRTSAVRLARCTSANCATNTTVNVQSTPGVPHLAMTLPPSGFPVIAFAQSFSSISQLTVIGCGDAACSSALQTYHEPDTIESGSAVQYISIAIGNDALPIMSYYNASTADLRVVKCNNAACSSSTATTIDSTGDVGKYSSITIAPDGLPFISYYDATNGDLKGAKCSNPACTGSSTISALNAEAGDVGQDTSATIGSDGLPFVSYTDVTNTKIKVAKCNNPFCAPYFRRR